MVDNKKRSVGTKESPEYIKKLIVAEARRQGVPVELALAIAQQESGFNNIAVSKPNKDGSRDHGVMQLNDKYHKLKNVYDPVENIRYGIGMIKNGLARNNGNIRKTLSDYNAGPNAVGEGRRKGDAYALKVMTIANRFKPQDINNIIASNAVSNSGEGVTGAAAQVDDVAGSIEDRVQALYDAGLRDGEDIVNKYIANQNYDTSMYNEIRARRQKEIEDVLKKIDSMPTRATQQDVQNVRDTYANARNALDTGYNNAMQTIRQGMGANQVDDYYNKLAQIDAQRLQEMREANPYTQLGQKAPLDLSNYANSLNWAQQANAMIRANNIAMGGQAGPVDFGKEALELAQARQAAEMARQTGLTPEQFLQGQMLNYNNMGTTYNNEQQTLANIMQAAYQGDRQAQSLLANIYTTQGTNNANLIKSQYEAERQADEDALNRTKYRAELAKWGVTQGQSLDTLPVQGDANFQQSKLSNTANTMNTNAQLGAYAGNNLMNYEQKLLAAANKAEEDQSSVDPNIYKAVKDYNTIRFNALGMNPHITPAMLNEATEEAKRGFSLVVPGLSPILYGNTPNTNYSQFNDITGQSTFRDRPKIK